MICQLWKLGENGKLRLKVREPIISYNRGGSGEIVQHEKTGFLVEPDNVDELVKAIAQIERIDRNTCRQQAEI
ncbi:MAG: glycosyltransferase [Phormidium sp.]